MYRAYKIDEIFGTKRIGEECAADRKLDKNDRCAGSSDFDWKLVSGRSQKSALGTQTMVPAVLVDTGHIDNAGVAAADPLLDYKQVMNS